MRKLRPLLLLEQPLLLISTPLTPGISSLLRKKKTERHGVTLRHLITRNLSNLNVT